MSNATDRHECQICAGSFKTNKAGKMVNHGYKRPGWGYIVGGCYGVGHAPFPATTAIEGAIAAAEKAIVEYTEKADNNTGAYVIYAETYRGRSKVERRRWVYSAEEYYNANAERYPRSYRAEWAEASDYDKGQAQAGFEWAVKKQTKAFRSVVEQAEADIVFWTARKEEGEKQQQQAAEPKTEVLRLPEGETQFEYQKQFENDFDATGMTLEAVVRRTQCSVVQTMNMETRSFTWMDGGEMLRAKLAQAGLDVPAERLAECGLA